MGSRTFTRSILVSEEVVQTFPQELFHHCIVEQIVVSPVPHVFEFLYFSVSHCSFLL